MKENLFKEFGNGFFPTIGLKITYKCRMKCDFCCEPNRNGKTPKFEELKPILQRLSDWGTRRICVTGGEPMLHPELRKILDLIKKLNMSSVLVTGDPEYVLKKINEIKSLDQIRFSIHGFNEMHDRIIGKNNCFDLAEKAIKKLITKNVNVAVTTVVTNKNLKEIEKIAVWAKNLGVRDYFLFGVMKSGKGNDFINKTGKIESKELLNIKDNLEKKYASDNFTLKCYTYDRNSECIIVYGTGDIIIDPYPTGPNHQLKLGNLNYDNKFNILREFLKDDNNIVGYNDHLCETFKD